MNPSTSLPASCFEWAHGETADKFVSALSADYVKIHKPTTIFWSGISKLTGRCPTPNWTA